MKTDIADAKTQTGPGNRIAAQFQALRYFCLDGTDHGSHREQALMIRRYSIWRNRNGQDRHYESSSTANVA